jgi:ketosteroid isomerase-like protein
MGLPASGRRFTLRGCDVTEVAGGKVRRVDAYWDSGALFRQLGGGPSDAPAST